MCPASLVSQCGSKLGQSVRRSIIPQIKSATVGYNVNEGDVFHVCIDSVFDSLEDLNTYIDHPEHQKVRAFMNEVSYDKTVFDYEF